MNKLKITITGEPGPTGKTTLQKILGSHLKEYGHKVKFSDSANGISEENWSACHGDIPIPSVIEPFEIVIDTSHLDSNDNFLANVPAHPIRPTQRTFESSTTFPPPVNIRLASAVGFVVLRIVRHSEDSGLSERLAVPKTPIPLKGNREKQKHRGNCEPQNNRKN
ncbi:hypothetical protein [Roseibacillus persicicus]|uniref:Uncharacterized protein n=1 Tax=Roseibacillus persicicus TaxID=454148 RepID=A0A918WRI2_9BACT|nr:hypothetical protein [Roseibacillus persicicus]GHC68195.1 hypothetical protein GCM10007100_40300 [Roseibacillus persicicus]